MYLALKELEDGALLDEFHTDDFLIIRFENNKAVLMTTLENKEVKELFLNILDQME